MPTGRRRPVLAAIAFSVLIVVLTLFAVSLLQVEVDARDWAVAIATAVVVGGFLTLLVMRRGLEEQVMQERARRAHVPQADATGAPTAFAVGGEDAPSSAKGPRPDAEGRPDDEPEDDEGAGPQGPERPSHESPDR